MKFTLPSLAVLGAALTQVTAQVPVGGQCGGAGWDGFSQLCADGSYCALISDGELLSQFYDPSLADNFRLSRLLPMPLR
ncbi:hypothetical protein M407DRAFT_19001 [Tulasnella calospora MUT 4182]|uniref:CBM1 domain-containing protein n=1 Tax=Tulasnella calospora MUT 4182 TaxID=1051891 RepID=A0A0C3LDG6_9AGAM|nr:hypothetical protein M407DRAFT_19001 [Tulasnella calospora MUT 4182]